MSNFSAVLWQEQVQFVCE